MRAVLQSLQDPYLPNRPAQFQLTEDDINQYLAYSLRLKPRPGIRQMSVRLHPDNAVSLQAVLDLQSIQKWHSWILPEALKTLVGTDPVVDMEVSFQAHDGYGTFKLNRAQVLGAALPVDAMAWIIQAISLHQPEYYDSLKPVPLPFGLRRIWTSQGAAAGDMESQPPENTPEPREP